MGSTRFVWLRLFAALFLVAAMATPAMADEWKDEAHGKARKEHKEKHRSKANDWEHRGYDGYFHEHGYTTLGIPPGHQPPPERCGHLRYDVPVGAWLIHRPKDKPTYVDVSVYDAYQPGIVISIGLFDVHTGAFLRHVKPQ